MAVRCVRLPLACNTSKSGGSPTDPVRRRWAGGWLPPLTSLAAGRCTAAWPGPARLLSSPHGHGRAAPPHRRPLRQQGYSHIISTYDRYFPKNKIIASVHKKKLTMEKCTSIILLIGIMYSRRYIIYLRKPCTVIFIYLSS